MTGKRALDHTGLVYDGVGAEEEAGVKGGEKKKAYFAYRTLARKMRGVRSAEVLGESKFKFLKNGARFYVVWGKGALGVDEGKVRVVDAEGRGRVAEDAASLRLTSSPVLIEPF